MKRYHLTNDEFNALMHISSVSHMDNWFDLKDGGKEGDYIEDLDNNSEVMEFEEAISQLYEGITDVDWNELDNDEKDALTGLFKKLNIGFANDDNIF